MKVRGAYKISNRGRAVSDYAVPLGRSGLRSQRILESLRSEILGGAGSSLRIRQVFESPREIFRLQLELPEYCYQRTPLLDPAALAGLLEAAGGRQAVRSSEA